MQSLYCNDVCYIIYMYVLELCCLVLPYLVSSDESHKHREEHGRRSRLGALPKIVDHIVEGFLENDRGRQKCKRQEHNICQHRQPLQSLLFEIKCCPALLYLGLFGFCCAASRERCYTKLCRVGF